MSDLQGRIDRAKAALTAAPDLNLKDYSKNQVTALVRAMQIAWAELSAGDYPDSVRYREVEN